MIKKKIREKNPDKVWAEFKERETLTEDQLLKFQKYETLLTEFNKSMNLTSISGLSETVNRHFADSLIFRKFIDLSKVEVVADVGSGAGFPGVPLKIMFPDLGVILIEVTKKKQRFLRTLISELGLKGIDVCDLDWRTFLRTTESKVDYFLARASIDPTELARLFKPGSPYKNSKLIYWATVQWEPEVSAQKGFIKKFVRQEFLYTMKRKERKLVLMDRGE